MIPFLSPLDPFPSLNDSLPNGLLAAGWDLSEPRLIDAYRSGIFPWFNQDEPVLWWSPDPRMVLYPDELSISRSLRKTLRRGEFTVTADTAFGDVIRQCAKPRRGQAGTWICDPIIAAYTGLHKRGIAHSVETWRAGQLVGGLYGVALGRMFYGESMFSKESDSSKVALARLVDFLKLHGFGMIDCQMETPHLRSMGARLIPRTEFLRAVTALTAMPELPGPWDFRQSFSLPSSTEIPFTR